MEIIVKLAVHGLVHCDYNEFNLMVVSSPRFDLPSRENMLRAKRRAAEHSSALLSGAYRYAQLRPSSGSVHLTSPYTSTYDA